MDVGELRDLLVGVGVELLDVDAALAAKLNDALLKGLLDAAEEVSLDEEELLLVSIVLGHHLRRHQADVAQLHQRPHQHLLQTVPCDPIRLHELLAVLAAPDHLGVEDVRLDVRVVLEDVVAVDEDERTQLLLLG